MGVWVRRYVAVRLVFIESAIEYDVLYATYDVIYTTYDCTVSKPQTIVVLQNSKRPNFRFVLALAGDVSWQRA